MADPNSKQNANQKRYSNLTVIVIYWLPYLLFKNMYKPVGVDIGRVA